jgi:hypothetical protein
MDSAAISNMEETKVTYLGSELWVRKVQGQLPAWLMPANSEMRGREGMFELSTRAIALEFYGWGLRSVRKE